MSYDLTVYCPDTPTADQVHLLVGNTRGLKVDPSDSMTEAGPDSVLVLRGVKSGYSFTVDGPFAVKPEDVPEEVLAVLPNAQMMFQVLVEGSVAAEIPHGVRFARKLAKTCHGLVLDEQTSEVWPQPRDTAPIVPKIYPRVDAVEFMWYFLADEMPDDIPQRYLRLTTEILPDARPDTFGSYYPYMGDIRRDGDEGFIAAFQSDSTPMHFYATYPVTSGSLDDIPSRRKGDVRLATLTMAREAFADERFRLAAKQFFLCFAQESNAFHANAEVVRNYTLKNQKLLRGPEAEQHRYCVNQNTWAGLQGHPQWWTWYGSLYAPMIRPHLTGHLEDHPDGIFHSWTEHPADRDTLTEMLPDPSQPWIPAEYSPVYEDGVVEPLSFAESMPQRLREARIEPLR